VARYRTIAPGGEAAEWVGSTNSTQEQAARLDPLLLSAAEKQGRPHAMLHLLGDLRMRFRPQDGIGVYREILNRNAEGLMAFNSLALLLALQRIDVPQSLKLIDRAIAIAGPVGTCLDKRAVALMACDRPDKALSDLSDNRGRPATQILFPAGTSALSTWPDSVCQRRASRGCQWGLKPQDLSGPERANYEEFSRKLAQQTPNRTLTIQKSLA
jgi:hypothetical protein